MSPPKASPSVKDYNPPEQKELGNNPPMPTDPPKPSMRSPSVQKATTSVPVLTKPVKGKSVPRCLFLADNGWGKTTTALYVGRPDETVLLMGHGETNYFKLFDNDLVPEVSCVEIHSWNDLTVLLQSWVDMAEFPFKVLVLDTLTAFERLVQTKVCNENYRGDWGSKGFLSYNAGPRDCLHPWIGMLNLLGKLNDRGAQIMILEQIGMKDAPNPLGDDFLKFVPRSDKWIANATKDWADMVLFGTWNAITDHQDSQGKDSAKTKGIGGTQRVVYTSNHDAYTAKNQWGLPPVIRIADDRTKTWATIIASKEGSE